MLPQCGLDLHFGAPHPHECTACDTGKWVWGGAGGRQPWQSPPDVTEGTQVPQLPRAVYALPWPQAQVQEASCFFLGGDKYLLCPLTNASGLSNKNICLTFLMEAG